MIPLAAAGHGWGLAVFPLLAFGVALVFGLQLAQRFVGKRRPHEGVWAVALLMFAVASLAMFEGVVGGWTPAEFRTYWLFGAILNVPFLFVGELYLLARRRSVGHAAVLVLAALSAFAAWSVVAANVHVAALRGSLPLGKDVFGDGSTPYRLAQYYAIPAYFLLLAGLVWSASQMRGRPDLRNRTSGTFGIAVGATIVAVGSGIGAAFHVVWLFAVSLAGGIAVMFWGFLVASRPSVPPPAANPT